MKLAPWSRWKQMVVDLATIPFRPPASSRVDRLGRRTQHEVMIYLAEDNTIYVQHLAMGGKGQAEIAIRMCWEAMQHLAMASGLGLSLPTQAAQPVQIMQPEPVPELVADEPLGVPTAPNGTH